MQSKAVLLIILLAVTQVHAEEMIQGVDAAPLIEYLRTSMYTVTAPFKLFHYFKGWGQYQGQFPSDDPRGFTYVKYNANQYLKKFGYAAPSGSFFGAGLYAATDPIASRDYGRDKDWQMAEIDIPTGFNFLKIDPHSPYAPNAAIDVLAKWGCGIIWSGPLRAHAFFQPYYFSQASTKCLDGMREAIARLRMDAFEYLFDGAEFAVCRADDKSDRQIAFVFVTDRWLKPEMVHLFNSQTVDNKAERKRIESTFFKNNVDTKGYYQSETVAYPSVISTGTLPMNSRSPIPVYWQDLNGETTDADIDSWIKDNVFRCGDHKNYEAMAHD